jgi:hypothetical protein
MRDKGVEREKQPPIAIQYSCHLDLIFQAVSSEALVPAFSICLVHIHYNCFRSPGDLTKSDTASIVISLAPLT